MNTLFRGMIAVVLFTNVALYCMEKGSGVSEAVIFPGSGMTLPINIPHVVKAGSPQSSPLLSPESSPTSSPRQGCLSLDDAYFVHLAYRVTNSPTYKARQAARDAKNTQSKS